MTEKTDSNEIENQEKQEELSEEKDCKKGKGGPVERKIIKKNILVFFSSEEKKMDPI